MTFIYIYSQIAVFTKDYIFTQHFTGFMICHYCNIYIYIIIIFQIITKGEKNQQKFGLHLTLNKKL